MQLDHTRIHSFAFFFFFLLVFFFWPNHYAFAGFGVSPTVISVDDILINDQVHREFVLSRGAPISTDRVEVTISGEVSDHIIAESEILLPQGQVQTNYEVVIDTRGLIAGKSYEAGLTFLYVPEDSNEVSMMQVYPGVQTKIIFSVTTEASAAFEVKEFVMPSIKEGKPLEFSYFLINSGNISTKPSQISIKLNDKLNADNEYNLLVNEHDLHEVRAFSSYDDQVKTNLRPQEGKYSADILVYNDSGVVFSKKNLSYQVEARYSKDFSIMAIQMGIIVCLVVIILLVGKRKRLNVKGEK